MKRLLALFVFVLPSWAGAATYYVDCNANGDAGAGTGTGAAVAWKTVAKVNASSFSAGDSVLFAKGCTWRETLTVPSSGSAGSPITFGAYGTGADPIFDGSNVITPGTSWAADTSWPTTPDFTDWTDVAGAYPTEYRNIIPASTFTTNGTKVRITVKAHSSASSTYDHVTIGEMATGDVFDGAPTTITFDTGNAGVVLSAGQTKLSDEIDYAFDKTKRYGVHISQATKSTSQGVNGYGMYYAFNDAQSATLDPTMDGGDATHTGSLSNLEIYSSTANAWNSAVTTEPKIVFFDGVRGTGVASKAVVNGARKWFWASNVLTVYGASDPDTLYTSPGVEVGARDYGIRIGGTTRSYITIQDVHLTRTNVDGFRSNVTGTQAGLIIQRVTTTSNRGHGMFFGQYHASEKTTGITVTGCTSYENGNSGISFDENLNTITISNNVVYHNNWGPELWTAGIKLFSAGDANDVLIEGNTVYGQYDGLASWPWSPGMGIWMDTLGTNVICRRNLVYDNAKVGIMAELGTGYEVSYNVVYGNGSYNVTTDERDAGILIYRMLSGTKIYNNTVYDNLVGIAVRGDLVNGAAVTSNNLIKNNIVTGSTYWNISATFGGENSGARGTGNVYVNNALGVEKAGMVEWGSGTSKATYAAWESAYGATTSSVQTDPLFLSSSDFRLQDASPAQGAGVNVSLTSDYAGTRVQGVPDIGAYETLGARFPVTAVTITTAGNVKRYDNRH